MRTFATSFVAIAIATTSFAAPAFAQDEAAADEGLGEIVVTAQRREENLQDVPLSVDVVSGDKLAAINSGGGDIRALAGRVPSLNIESSFGRTFPRFYNRGLGNTDFDIKTEIAIPLLKSDLAMIVNTMEKENGSHDINGQTRTLREIKGKKYIN